VSDVDLDSLHERQKEKWGYLATWSWMTASLYFYAFTPGYHLLSLSAALIIPGRHALIRVTARCM
jgi:hypothetical protein